MFRGFSALVAISLVASGVIGLLARRNVPQAVPRRQAVAAVFRVLAGAFFLAIVVFSE